MNIEQVKLTKIYINDTKKDGTKLIDRSGKPYKKIAIQTDKHAGYLSDFIFNQDDPKLQWQVGNEVEIIVTMNGDFKNFKVPTKFDKLELRVEALEEFVKNGSKDERIVKHNTLEELNKDIEGENEIDVADLPF